jgi:hypothetical protein
MPWNMRLLLMWLIALLPLPMCGQTPFAFSCAEDSHVDAAKKKAIDAVATNFVGALLSATPGDAFEAFSKEGQKNVTREQLIGQGAALIKQFQPKNLTVEHTYLVRLVGNSPGRIVCAADLSKPEGWEALSAANVPEQAHVAMSADAVNNQLAFTVWLIPEGNTWKVQSFWMNVSSLADKNSIQLWQMAREQKARSHNFNATLLYAAAGQIANRGPDFQLGIAQSISEEIPKLVIPAEIQGPPPFTWKNGATTLKILNVGPAAVGGKIYIIILHEVGPWQTDSQVERWNKELLNYFKGHFPEYSEVFAGLVARAKDRESNRLYGTVEESPDRK